LGPLGINVLQVVNTINDKTKDFSGMKVPVKVEVDSETKNLL
jgi:large subunit ribosomal protein L11